MPMSRRRRTRRIGWAATLLLMLAIVGHDALMTSSVHADDLTTEAHQGPRASDWHGANINHRAVAGSEHHPSPREEIDWCGIAREVVRPAVPDVGSSVLTALVPVPSGASGLNGPLKHTEWSEPATPLVLCRAFFQVFLE